jgi:hypothetical protein
VAHDGPEPGFDAGFEPADQAAAAAPVLDRRTLGRGWIDAPMVNNEPRLDPHGTDPASEALRARREARRLTGLHEGRAWRRRGRVPGLVVVRHELFADPDPAERAAHREDWTRLGAASLDATWRERWRERHVTPGWVESRRVGPPVGAEEGVLAEGAAPHGRAAGGLVGGVALPEAVDWFRVEDHTDPSGGGEVTVYEHLTVWGGRHLVTVTVRHPLGEAEDPLVAVLAGAVVSRLPHEA